MGCRRVVFYSQHISPTSQPVFLDGFRQDSYTLACFIAKVKYWAILPQITLFLIDILHKHSRVVAGEQVAEKRCGTRRKQEMKQGLWQGKMVGDGNSIHAGCWEVGWMESKCMPKWKSGGDITGISEGNLYSLYVEQERCFGFEKINKTRKNRNILTSQILK